MLKIIADEAIPWLDMLFAGHGHIHRYSGRELNPQQLKDADVLLIRSTLKVTKSLLEDTNVKLVASATVGCDHVDQLALKELGIAFVHAPGCNANAVAEYVIAALAWHAMKGRINLTQGLTAAVIGCGRIGSKVKEKLELLGIDVFVNDPPLALSDHNHRPSWKFVSLERALKADIICLHTPLTRTGEFPTYHLLDLARLETVREGAVLINAGRGAVVNNRDLLTVLEHSEGFNAVLDVWENEPGIDLRLLDQVSLGTPHIAGHSWRGKVMGTVMIYQQFCKYFDLKPQPIDDELFKVSVPDFVCHDDVQLYELVAKCYDIEADTLELRHKTIAKSAADAAFEFDHFRKSYYQRAEFSDLTCNVKLSIADQVSALGFNVKP